jgi:adenylate cyclase
MTDTVMKYDGTVDKYEGDAIMAFWGAPLVQPNHAKQGCITALENLKRLKELNEELEKKGMQKLSARCGLNTGPMNVGNMGSTQKFNYTVMGDSVNLASRLEGANKQYGTNLMISEMTCEQARDEIEVRELDLLRVKGKKVPIKVFELVSRKGELTDAQKKGIEIYNQGLALYRKRDFKGALSKFQGAGEFMSDDGPSQTYIQRTKDYLESPPAANWDGVFVLTTK